MFLKYSLCNSLHIYLTVVNFRIRLQVIMKVKIALLRQTNYKI